MGLFQIEGLSGTGKSVLCQELVNRGYYAIDADAAFGYFGDPETGKLSNEKEQLTWNWNKNKFLQIVEIARKADVFVCGGAMNQEDFSKFFIKRFTLFVDDDTLRSRLLHRTNNDFGKKPADLAKQLEWNKGTRVYAANRGTILIDATKPLSEVADEVLRQALGHNFDA